MTVAIAIHKPNELKRSIRIKPFWWIRAQFYRLWWHTKAYATVFGVAVLVVLSLVMLYGQQLIESRNMDRGDRNQTKQNGELTPVPRMTD